MANRFFVDANGAHNMSSPVSERPIPALLRMLGARFRDGRRSFRMSWGELSFGRSGWAIGLNVFDDPPHFSFHVHAWRLFNAYIQLPFLRRFAHRPEEMMETWGVSYDGETGYLCFRWGQHYKMITMPWRDWTVVGHDVWLSDGTWASYVGSWERDKTPDGRYIEQHPYHYLLRNGETQERTASVHVERYIRRLEWLKSTPHFQSVTTSLSIEFSDEVGERSGSWKGGTIGCGYDMRPHETMRECLKRMEQERRF